MAKDIQKRTTIELSKTNIEGLRILKDKTGASMNFSINEAVTSYLKTKNARRKAKNA